MRTKGKNVRLTEQAHILCSTKAGNCKTSMKAVASEAIFLLVRGEDRDQEQYAYTEFLKKKIRDHKLFAFGTFILGALVSGCLMFFVGAM